MKTLIKTALCAIMMVMCSTAVMAQSSNNKQQRISREELVQKQAGYISAQLALDDAVSKKFIATYTDYQKEVWAIGARLQHRRQQNLSDAEAEQTIKQRMERSEKIIALRKKYYNKYSQFLTQKQIQRVYELERQNRNRLAHKKSGIHRQHSKR